VPGAPVTEQDKRRVRELHARNLSRNAIAREMGRSGRTVSRIADELGLSFDRAPTVTATEARKADAKALRAALTLDYLRDAQRLRQQLWEPHIAYNFGGRDNTYEQHRFPEPPTDAKLKLVQASTLASDRSMKLELHDADHGAEGARSMLGALAAGLQVAYEQMQPDDAGQAEP
jgi:hypothetical protein